MSNLQNTKSRFGYNMLGQWVDINTDQPPTQEERDLADSRHADVVKADSAYEIALRKAYGNAACTMRYRTLDQTGEVRRLNAEYQAACELWRNTWRTL